MINAGELAHRIVIQAPPITQDDYNQATGNWTDVLTAWASIKPLSGKMFFEAQAAQSEVTHKIIMRYTRLVKPTMRVFYCDRYFRIDAVINVDEKNVELWLMCSEVFVNE